MSPSSNPLRFIDCHVHLWTMDKADRMLDIRRELGFERMNLLSIVDPRRGDGNRTVLAAKARHPDAFYAFGGLDHAAASGRSRRAGIPLDEQARRLWQAGCDGIKIIETKPTSRRRLDQAVDGPYYRDFFAFVEAEQAPLLWHVADPEEFWDPRTTPWWAAKHDWGYGPNDVPKEQLYSEVGRVLDRHPRLKVIFAHMYFLSADLPRLERMMDRYPGVNVDLAPGVEFLFNLSMDVQRTRDFLTRRQDRIFFGTDITDGLTVEEARIRTDLIRRFLQTDEEFSVPSDAEELLQSPGRICGLALPQEVLVKIYHGNFARLVGQSPRAGLPLGNSDCG